MKKIVALLLAMVITAALLAGGTAAYASVYTPTTPDIVVQFDGTTKTEKEMPANGDLWEPGYTVFKNIKVDCNDSAEYYWTVTLNQEATTLELPNLADVLEVYWAYTEDVKGLTRSAAMKELHYVGTLNETLNGAITISGERTGGTSITLVLKMRESAGNEYQGCTEAFNVVMTVSAKTGSN